MAGDETIQLPDGFEDLDRFADWALAKESERMRKRWSSSMDEITCFYDAMASRIEAVLDHLDRFDLNALPRREERLLFLALSLAEAASAVETYKQPGVRYGFETPDRYLPTEDEG